MQENNKEELMNNDDNEKDSLSELRDMANNLRLDSIVEPLAETVRIANKSKAVTGVSSYANQLLGNLGNSVLNAMKSETAEIISQFAVSALQGMVNAGAKLAKSAFVEWLSNVDASPIISALNEFVPKLKHSYEEINSAVLKSLHETRWFPYASWAEDDIVLCEVIETIQKNPSVDIKTKNIDRIMFTYYSKEKIESMRVSWKALGLPKHTLKILNEAVRAYHRREHALTVLSLVSFWEGIIAEKVHKENERRNTQKTNENLKELLDANNLDEVFNSYCKDYIFYNCNSKEEYKDDVPGRHSYAHSWFTSYPNRKAALNAILFTDFLFKLDEIPIEDTGGEKDDV